jgi:hypothetical protein
MLDETFFFNAQKKLIKFLSDEISMIIFICFFTTEALMMAREKGNCYG